MESLILLTALVGVDLAITDTASPRLAITEVAPESPLVGYYFNASWCANCKATDAVMQELIAAGLNVEVIDVDERSDLATLYGVDAVPKFVRFDGANYRWNRGAMSRERIADFYGTPLPGAKPAGVVATSQAASVGFTQPVIEYKTVVRSDMHTHVCNRCGYSWSHSDRNHGSYSAHRCARCGNLDWDISSHSARVTVPVQTGGYVRSQPVRQYASRAVYRSCPNCPR